MKTSSRLLAAALLTSASLLQAQGTPAAPPPAVDFSGVLIGTWQTRTDSAARAQSGGRNPNQFTIERVYLTFRMPAGDRASIRATTDIFQNPNGGYYNGWSVRLKYGYLQYALKQNAPGRSGWDSFARLGMLQTVVIEHEEQFWPRYLGVTGVERFGFFSSADLGVAGQVSFPRKLGEVYAHVVNGPGYTAPEADRFKDVGLRLTLTPFSASSGWLRTFAFSPWAYRGATASRYAAGGAGQVGPVSDAVDRNRWGIFTGVRDPRLTLGLQYARRTEGFEPANANTPTVPRTVADSTGTLLSIHGVARPFSWNWGKNVVRLGVVGRYDRFEPRTALAGTQRYFVAGLQLEPTARTAISLDLQDLSPRGYPAGSTAADQRIVPSRTWFVHWTANF